MKNFKILFLTLFILFSTAAYAVVLNTDNFNGSSADSWSRDDGTDNYLQLNQDKTSSKTYDFGSTYANIGVEVTFTTTFKGGWESSGDYFAVTANGSTTTFYITGANGSNDITLTRTVTTTLDGTGKLVLSLYSQSSASKEKSYTDYVTISTLVPSITPATYTIYNLAPTGTIVGTIAFSGGPTAFTILSGNTDSIFSVTSSGDITVASGTNLENNTSSVYTLEINASNSVGYDVQNFTINLTNDIALSSSSINTRDFTNIPVLGKDSITINGSILQIGNQLLCYNSADGATCQAPDEGKPNNDYNQHKVRIDTSTGSPSNNSMAMLVMQPGDEVVYAGLYWSARITSMTATQKTDAKTIQIKGPNASSYTSVTSYNAKYNWYTSGSTTDYGASQDVTEYVQAQGAGEYYVGGITATNGSNYYASWELIVIVKNPDRSLKNIALYDGFYEVANATGYPSSATVDAKGFITPTGVQPFNANLFIYTGESDKSYDDSVSLLKKDGNPAVSADWTQLVDGANTSNDVVNASVYSLEFYPSTGYRSDIAGMANPNFKNVLGVDIDELVINDKSDSSKQILSNGQTSTKIKIATTWDQFSLNMFAFETEVFIPEFCYDYAYSQLGTYFTEDNNGTKSPALTGSVVSHQPIELSIFIKSLVDSSISIDNMSIDVSDINRTQATYIADSTKVATVGQLVAQPVTVTAGTTGNNDYIHNIDIGTLQQNDYFYVYYNLDPQINTMNMPIKVDATYDLTLDLTSVPYTLTLSKEIPLCTSSNFNYLPAKGIFNIVHNNFYNLDLGGTSHYYNLPTQVTKREGDFKVLEMDPLHLDTLLSDHPATIAAVEMIDAGGYHYTDASCKDLASSISQRVWVIFDANATSEPFNQAALTAAISEGRTDLVHSYDFYTIARQNAAFRVTYNSSDINGSITSLTKSGSTYTINNFTLAGQGCSKDMNNDGILNEQVNTYCKNGMNTTELKECMECIYGKDTRFICSRDNFAIRPEAFMLNIDDQNQTSPVNQVRLTTNYSGVSAAVAPLINLSAGYNYNLEINATNHIDNMSSLRYSKSLDLSVGNDTAQYAWNPISAITAGACNDENNQTIYNGAAIAFVDGAVDMNTSINQVGEYTLNVTDTTWTIVDYNSTYMEHHSGYYFLPNTTPDCVLNNSQTQTINSATLNGCNISSNHTNNDANLKYNDYSVSFHPYKFDLRGLVPSFGITNDGAFSNNTFVYMSDMSVSADENMSMHINGLIKAVGENNVTLSNFVNGCFAKPINVDINKTNYALPAPSYGYRYHDFNSTNSMKSTLFADINNTTGPIALNTTHFLKDMLGSVNSILNLNFDRNLSNPINPKTITFDNYTIDCQNPGTDCTYLGDLTTKTTQGNYAKDTGITSLDLNLTVKHYYGRTHAPRYRYQANNGDAIIYYEVYCKSSGDMTLLPNASSPVESVDELDWYNNINHTLSRDGNVTTVTERKTSPKVTLTGFTLTNPQDEFLTYDVSAGYPYKTTMQTSTSGWLIYNKYNNAATMNEFEVEFYNPAGNWTGVHDTNTTTDSNANGITSKRIFW